MQPAVTLHLTVNCFIGEAAEEKLASLRCNLFVNFSQHAEGFWTILLCLGNKESFHHRLLYLTEN